METLLAILVGLYMTAAVYLLLSKNLVRLILGVALLSNGVNILIFTAGRLTEDAAAFVPFDAKVPSGVIANSLPQALILTAIVIGFSFFAFLLVLIYRACQDLETDNIDDMKLAEPIPSMPPLGY